MAFLLFADPAAKPDPLLGLARAIAQYEQGRAEMAEAQVAALAAQRKMDASREAYQNALKAMPGYRDGCTFDQESFALKCPEVKK